MSDFIEQETTLNKPKNQNKYQNNRANADKFKNVCRNWMNHGCTHPNCKFIHDPELCVRFYNTGKCDGLCNRNHFANPNLSNQNFRPNQKIDSNKIFSSDNPFQKNNLSEVVEQVKIMDNVDNTNNLIKNCSCNSRINYLFNLDYLFLLLASSILNNFPLKFLFFIFIILLNLSSS